MPGRTVRAYTVLPTLPDRLQSLRALADNLWWCWHPDAVELFRRIDQDLFAAVDHSPVRMLTGIDQKRLRELGDDADFLAHLDRVTAAFHGYLTARTWFQDQYPDDQSARIAYFSMEFGIHESVPVYSGGLGVLAGDHLKSASDLGLPLCGVSLMYREGYFRQYLNADGWQQERYPENDFFNLPLIAETDASGKPVIVSAPLPGRDLQLKVWRIQVGRVPLYLLDANIPTNSPEDRAITSQLYGGDQTTRIQQEIILGIGGYRALRAVGKEPTVCHMNEGHAAFCALERVRVLMTEHRLDFDTALEAAKAGTCFTTHTPVPAGNDAFPPQLIEQYLGAYLGQLGADRTLLYTLGRQHPTNVTEPFGMTVLALKTSNTSNGVSALHGEVSRKMWQTIWDGLPAPEVPIGSITNGVHTASWVAPEVEQLFTRYVSDRREADPTDFSVWQKVDAIPDAELWRTHERCRARLVALCRARLQAQYQRRGASPAEVRATSEALDPDALTIGFARRFATYKRGDLIFRDAERLARLMNDSKHPVQLVFAGKAHPKDSGGKELIARVVHMARKPEFRARVVFVEDYDMNVARHLVHGVDVWLNNPRRPLEASGTSGMKAAVNGGLNLSILDGWWVEGYDGTNGWAIGNGEEYPGNEGYGDEVEGRTLAELIEREVVPLFYDRGPDGLPRGWIQRMKRSIGTLVPVFNTHRMVKEYLTSSYLPSHRRAAILNANGATAAAELAAWRKRVSGSWSKVRVENVEAATSEYLRVGENFPVTVNVNLDGLKPDDVEVQLVHGQLDANGEIGRPTVLSLTPAGPESGGRVRFGGTVTCGASGQFGYCVRVLPRHANLPNRFEPALVTWG